MKLHVRVLYLFVTVALLAALTVGYGATTTAAQEEFVPKASPAEITTPVELRIWVWTGGDAEFHQQAADVWMKANPNYTIKVEAFEHAALMDQVKQAVAAGEAGDVLLLNAGPVWVEPFAKAGKILNLDAYYQKYGWEDKIVASNKMMLMDGHYYFVGSDLISYPLIYYDVDVFSKLGLKPPVTEAEFETVAQTLKDNGYGALALGTSVNYFADDMFCGIAPQFIPNDEWMGILFSDRPGYKGIKFTDPRMVEALTMMKRWVDLGITPEGMNGIDHAQMRALFTSGKFAMLHDGSWGASMNQKEAPDKNIDVFPYPQQKADIPVSLGVNPNNGYSINASTQYPDAAAEYVNYLLSPDIQKLFFKGWSRYPVRIDIPESELAALVPPIQMKIYKMNSEMPAILGLATWLTAAPNEDWRALLQDVIGGKYTPQEALEKFELEVEQLQAQ